MSSCTGCLIENLEEFQVKPGLCITVHFDEISDHLYNTVSQTVHIMLLKPLSYQKVLPIHLQQ